MRSCTSNTASTEWLRGVSGVFRTGVAVFTSTSHRVSACAGMGSCVFGSTFRNGFYLGHDGSVKQTRTCSCWNIWITSCPRRNTYPRLYIWDLRLQSVSFVDVLLSRNDHTRIPKHLRSSMHRQSLGTWPTVLQWPQDEPVQTRA
jgi:hypothetical protein